MLASDSLSALAMGVLADRAGIPKGVLSIVPSKSSSEIGKEFCENPIVRKLTFTGSTAVGRHLAGVAAGNLKRVSVELGGHAPVIVCEDTNVEAAAISGAGHADGVLP